MAGEDLDAVLEVDLGGYINTYCGEEEATYPGDEKPECVAGEEGDIFEKVTPCHNSVL